MNFTVQRVSSIANTSEGAPAAQIVSSERASRVTWVDVGKGLTISLVVLFHVFEALAKPKGHIALPEIWTDGIGPALRFARMPAFFFLAGVFFPRSLSKGPSLVVKNRLATLAYPYVVWTIVQITVVNLGGDLFRTMAHCPWSEIPYTLLIKPYPVFWFLYVLFFALMLYIALTRARLNRMQIFGVAVVFYLCGETLIEWLHLTSYTPMDRLRIYFLYLAMGAVLGEKMVARARSIDWPILLGVIALAILAMWPALALNWPKGGRSAILVSSAGVAGLLSIAILIDRTRASAWLRAIGRASLPIYVAHMLFLNGSRTLLSHAGVSDWRWHVLVEMTAGIGGPFLLAALVERLRIPFVFTLTRQKSIKSPKKPTKNDLPSSIALAVR